jgi:antirestriction protein ArdC
MLYCKSWRSPILGRSSAGQPTVIENQAAYLAGWLKQLKSDKKLVISAAGQAQRAADWILNERGETA